MHRHFDVLVAGAGPGGSLAALVLARAGYRVALLDRAQFPRPKVCGDCVNPNAGAIWERHGLTESFRALPYRQMDSFTLQVKGRTIFQQPFAQPLSGPRAISRTVLDDWLRRQAEEAGALFFPETTITGWQAPGTVQTSAGDFSAELVLAADGRNSLLSRLAGLLPKPVRCHRVAYQTTLPWLSLKGCPVLLNLFPEGYYGLNYINEREANFCMVLDSRCTHGLADAQRLARRYLPDFPETEWRTTSPIVRTTAELGRDRLWLLGDAARVVEPFTGEGIYLALATGELAARHAFTLLEKKQPGIALAGYQRAHRKLYSSRIWVNKLTRWSLSEPRRALWLASVLARFPGVLRYMTDRVHATGQPLK